MICARSDITFADVRFSQFMEKLTVGLWTCVKRVFNFISEIEKYGTYFYLEHIEV